jgi:hypothetical protein
MTSVILSAAKDLLFLVILSAAKDLLFEQSPGSRAMHVQ